MGADAEPLLRQFQQVTFPTVAARLSWFRAARNLLSNDTHP